MCSAILQTENDLQKKMQVLDKYSKICLKRPHKYMIIIGFQDRLSLNAGQKYCRMLSLEHSAILLTFIKLPFVIVYFEWPLKTCFTVQ